MVCAALTVAVPGLLCPLSGWQVLKPGAYAIDPLITRLHELKCVQGASLGCIWNSLLMSLVVLAGYGPSCTGMHGHGAAVCAGLAPGCMEPLCVC